MLGEKDAKLELILQDVIDTDTVGALPILLTPSLGTSPISRDQQVHLFEFLFVISVFFFFSIYLFGRARP